MNDNKKLQKSVSNVGLREAVNIQAEEYNGKQHVLGLSGLTWVSYISSARAIMSTTHAQHARNILYPELPKFETGMERMVGDLSTSYKKAENELEVFAIIPKYNMEGKEKHLYLMFLYDRKADKYTVIEKKNVEDLTEKFGYLYDNRNMDSKEVGEVFNKGDIIYSSNSYDEFGNYRRGLNVKFVYQIHNDTIEDAALISESLSRRLATPEVESVTIPMNDNVFMKNRYGKGDEYKGFPDIGEPIKDGILAATMVKHNDQVLYTMNSKNLKTINYSSDTPYYCDGIIEDITIYSNKSLDEIPDDKFNSQIKFYLKLQNEFYQKVMEVTSEILNSGSKYSSEITFWYQKAKDVLDPMVLYKTEENRKFNNFVFEFLVSRIVPGSLGDKIAGRAGNKGVISRIVPDDEMPILETGERVDLILNTLGLVNRLTSQPLFENSVNFIGNRVYDKLVQLDSYEEKDELLLHTISYFNTEQHNNLKKFLETRTESEKEMFYKRLDVTGIITRVPPMWDDIPMFERLTKYYKENDWVKPYKVFVKKFGRWVRMMHDLYVGDIYILKLKQTSSKGLIARSTGSISRRGIPVKSKKPHKEPYSKTPIRFGDGENSNFGIGIPTPVIAKMHLLYRNSPVARQYLGEQLSNNVEGLTDVEITEMMTNRNAEILNAYFKFKGIKLEFHDKYQYLTVLNNKARRVVHFGEDDIFVGNDREMIKEKIRREVIAEERWDGVFRIQKPEDRRKEISVKVDAIFEEKYQSPKFK